MGGVWDMSGEHGIIEDGMYMGYERMGCIWDMRGWDVYGNIQGWV